MNKVQQIENDIDQARRMLRRIEQENPFNQEKYLGAIDYLLGLVGQKAQITWARLSPEQKEKEGGR